MNSGIYRQRSYDNLQNGKSPTYSLSSRFANIPHTSCDHTVVDALQPQHQHLQQQHLLLQQQLQQQTSALAGNDGTPVPVPTQFKYFSPQQRKYNDKQRNASHLRYPYHKNRAVSRRHLPSLSSTSNEDVRMCVDMNSPTQQQQNVYRYHRTPQRHPRQRQASALSLLKDLDFIDSCEDDPMLKNHNQFRVTKHQYSSCDRSADRSPLKKKQRYSNIYDYSFNLSLNSIHEDSTSDDSL